MTCRRTLAGPLAALTLLAVLPAAAAAHAYLIRTSPTPSRVLNTAPRQVALTFDEAVEPRFAIISVTDVNGRQEATATPGRAPGDPGTLTVSLRAGLPEGWYLVLWRAISVDGHPVQGAFTYAVGPNPGPAPQFVVPRVSATAVTPGLLAARWALFLAVMVSIGLFALRVGIARATVRLLPGLTLRSLERAFALAALAGLVLIPVYLDLATANDSLRSALDVGVLVPLFRVTAFGRGLEDLELCFALFCAAAAVALWVDRPDRARRSVAELLALTGAGLAGAATLLVPGALGHAGQTSPRGLSVALDWAHLAAGSVWLGGLLGLLILWWRLGTLAAPGSPSRLQVLGALVPRFSAVALGAVALLLASGTGATIVHMPALSALWGTGYGVAILVKLGLLGIAVALAAVNLLRTRPRLAAELERGGEEQGSTLLLRRLVAGETVIVAGAVFAAAVLSSLAPPPPTFALTSRALAQVGPGRVVATVHRSGYALQVLVSPNRAAAPDDFALRITRGGTPVRGATVTLTFNHTEMQMPQQTYALTETRPGVYTRAAPALIMVGRWALAFSVAPPGAAPFTALILDQANG